MEQSLAKQRESVEKQRASVRAQVPAASSDSSFFTVPWTSAFPAAAIPADTPDCEPVPEEQIGPLIEEISQREGLTPDLLRAVIQKESAFLPCAVSRKGAQGLMQLMPATAADFGVQDPFDPNENVNAGAKFLKQLLGRYGGDLVLALGAYNAGPGRVDSIGRLPLFPETVNYVAEILEKLGGGIIAETQRPQR
jgi:soluble lytic murein transglycosylase-like protein